MALETATYLPQLVSSNPGHTDGLTQADSHLRLIKSVLLSTFPNFTAAELSSTQAQLDAAVASVTGATALRMLAGTAALPGLTPVGDVNTGLFSAGADKIGLATNGLKALEVDSTQKVSMTADAAVAGKLAVTGTITGPGTVPIGTTLEWWEDTLPDASFGTYVWANGQVIASADTVCPALLARWGSKFGGNGVTTMGVPDRREVAAIGKATMGATASPGRITNYVATTIGGFIGACLHLLTTGEMPAHSHSATVTDPGHIHNFSANAITTSGSALNESGGANSFGIIGSTLSATTGISVTNANTGGGGSHDNVSPGIVCNFVLRIA